MVHKPDFQSAKAYALERLETQLSLVMSYHSVYHTRDDVLPAAVRLAMLEGVNHEDMILLKTAVLYHDIGFTVQVENHEILSAQIAAEVLPDFGYNASQIQKISNMILVTKLFTPPRTMLEAIMVDADLDVLGREDYFKRNRDLRNEITALGKMLSDEQWFTQQYKFMQIHRYRTISAQSLRNPTKTSNAALLSKILEGSITVPHLMDENPNARKKAGQFRSRQLIHLK